MRWTADVMAIAGAQMPLQTCIFGTDYLFHSSWRWELPSRSLASLWQNGKPGTGFTITSDDDAEQQGAQVGTSHGGGTGHNDFLGIIRRKSRLHWIMLVLCCTTMLVSAISVVLLSRFYFTQGGSRRWLSAWVQTVGWPVSALALGIMCWNRGIWRPVTLKHALVYTGFGVLNALDCLLYSWGISYLPASTNSLLSSSQLAFNCIFALLIVRQRVSVYAWNAVVLITASAVLLALHTDSDRPPGLTKAHYILGFVMAIAAAALYGLILPLLEIMTKNMLAGDDIAVGEVQTYTNITSTVVLTIGMAVNKDFSAMHHESLIFESGPLSYYMTLFWTAILWQVQYLSTTGVILLTSSLLAGTILTATTPLGSIFAVVFFHDKFGGLKVMAMLLSVWGFISYSFGGFVDSKAKAQAQHAP